MVGESTEEFEPLFDYHRVQPLHIVSLDDELDSTPVAVPKRRKFSHTIVINEEENKKDVAVVDCDEKDDDDWMPPPPKVSNDARKFEEDSTIKQLRLKKQELASYAKSAEEVLRSVEQAAKRDFDTASLSTKETDINMPPKPNCERAKIVISIQDKEELQQFRTYKDEKFERLFMMYAEKNKLDLQTLIFRFDGEKINPSASPNSLDMEDEDIIEVHIKSK